ncbi:P-loop NTPase [Rhizosaccharibacter radicis]|uniref:Iron-sulfur cluster carrier protein n=1 Tax=Rhizosaccharibacter radicis TaxID=2782605 RepID=A0ABT1W427_9PROT|nr:Mrp/NBP35 family ATP-binding protein [Acetobacteraceae bacterium KSS12]
MSTPLRQDTPEDRAAVEAVLRAARLPGSQDPFASGLVDGIRIRDGMVQVALHAERDGAAALEPLRAGLETALRQLPGVINASVLLTAHRDAPPAAAPRPGAAPAAGHRPIGLGGQAAGGRLLPDVRAVVAVASGKGGVGKSTTAVNLAVGLARLGLSVGLLDADIHGPSLPRMLGLNEQPEVRNKRLQPMERWGVRAMSIGLLVDERSAMIWRGPMVMGALQQLMGDVDWGALDVLVVDMPPGTGDAQLTLAQKVPLAGAVIVSTPQDIALLDARRGVAMFNKTNVPVLGIVENMSVFCCPNCGHRAELFGHGGARREAEALGVPFLGEIPLLLDIRTHADAGTPVLAAAPDGEAGRAYAALAARVAEALAPALDKPRGVRA